MNEIQTQRTPDIIGAEIRGLTQQAKTMTLWFGIEIGRRLTEAKEMLEHGQWLAYLKEQTEFSRSSAGRLMTLYKEYGAAQTSLFGAEANYPTLNNLSISNALRLLAVPEDEREEFAAEHDVEHMSARELDELIKQRDEAEKRAAKAEEQVQQAADGAAKADEQYQKAKQELHLLREKLENAEAQKSAAEKELSELRERPVEVDVEVDEKAVEEAVTAARAKNDAEWAEKMAKVKNELSEAGLKAEKLKAKIKKAEEKAAASAAELEKLKKSQTLSDPNTAVFKQIFEQVQEDFNKLHGSLLKVKASDPDTAEKLAAAVRALVDKMQGALDA
jgi:DNA repair exonuclease SbcCD ATPase subunit